MPHKSFLIRAFQTAVKFLVILNSYHFAQASSLNEILKDIETPQRSACASIRSKIASGERGLIQRTERISQATYYITPILESYHRGECRMQGSCIYNEGNRTLLRNVGHRDRYPLGGINALSDLPSNVCPFGYGSSGPYDPWDTTNCLDPCTTIAADGNYPKGSIVFIPSMVGRTCPHSGQPVDGCFMVSDKGDAIRGGGRFDFFTGICSNYRPNSSFCEGSPEFIQGINGETFHVIDRDTPEARNFRAQQAEIINRRWQSTRPRRESEPIDVDYFPFVGSGP